MNIEAKITGVKYQPFLCKTLKEVPFTDLDTHLQRYTSYLCTVDKLNQVAIGWWVSPKRTRSYPYARVYDTLSFAGKKATIIPVFKDEGIEGDRDYLQWDTISLMSLLGVYVIISYYKKAIPSRRYANKITRQQFDADQVKEAIQKLITYQSDALHWNVIQVKDITQSGKMAVDAYNAISQSLNVRMHSMELAFDRFENMTKNLDNFMQFSRKLAVKAQNSESQTTQPKELLAEDLKSKLTIRNYLGGEYYLTADEASLQDNNLVLVEGKHSRLRILPSLEDIKDGLIKMCLFSNLCELTVDGQSYPCKAVLKLTSDNRIYGQPLDRQKPLLLKLEQEATANHFSIVYE